VPAKITPERIEQASEEARRYYHELSNRLLSRGMKALPNIRIYVSRKITKNYGYAAFRRKESGLEVIKIAIAWQAYRKGPSMWHDVVAHEAAHAYCMAYHNRADHSPSWRHIARLLGCTGDIVGCEDAGKRDQAKATADALPTVISKPSARDLAAVRRSFQFQKGKYADPLRAIQATVQRFPQFDERQMRDYLFRLCGISLPKRPQLELPF
jgi:hypothetical protein